MQSTHRLVLNASLNLNQKRSEPICCDPPKPQKSREWKRLSNEMAPLPLVSAADWVERASRGAPMIMQEKSRMLIINLSPPEFLLFAAELRCLVRGSHREGVVVLQGREGVVVL